MTHTLASSCTLTVTLAITLTITQVASLDITDAVAVAAAVRSVDVVVNCAVTRCS